MESSARVNQLNTINFFNNEHHIFSDYTLLMPAVSVGNVGQLAVDLYLENCHPRPIKVGQLFHTALEPVVGDGGNGRLLVASEVFHHPQEKIVILQFYSPVIKRHQSVFVSFLVNWIKHSNFREVICLGSSLASLRNDVQLNASAVRYLAGSALTAERVQKIQRFTWLQLESRSGDGSINIPGGGIAGDLFVACNSVQIPILTLVIFASDGDNTPESTALLRSLNQLFNFLPNATNGDLRLRIPAAWKYFNGGAELPVPLF